MKINTLTLTLIQNKYFLPLLLFVVALILRLLYLSKWLEDWDSVQFALALHNYSLSEQQPHPPGYPIYIFLGRILNALVQNDTVSLTLLSAFLGALTVIPLFFLVKQFTTLRIAGITSMLFIVTPLHWLLSEVALTNVPGMFFTVLTTLLLYKGINSPRFLLLGSFSVGFTLGVRFAEYSILISLLLLVLYFKKTTKVTAVSFFLFAFGVTLWLIPVILDTGLSNFLRLYLNQVTYITRHDSIVAYTTVSERLKQIMALLEVGYTAFYFPIAFIIILFLATHIRRVSTKPYIFTLVWFLSYAAPLLFIYNLEVPRYVLPLLPPIIILLALALQSIKQRKVVYILAVALILFIFYQGLNLAKQQKELVPPTIEPVLYVKNYLDPKQTTLITTYTYRQFQYYAPEFRNYYDINNTPNTINSQNVIIDYLGIKNKITPLSSYQTADTKEFSGPKEIFPRLPTIHLYILKKP